MKLRGSGAGFEAQPPGLTCISSYLRLAQAAQRCRHTQLAEWPYTVPNDTGVRECVCFTRVVTVCGSRQYFHMFRGFGLKIKSGGGNGGFVTGLITRAVNFRVP